MKKIAAIYVIPIVIATVIICALFLRRNKTDVQIQQVETGTGIFDDPNEMEFERNKTPDRHRSRECIELKNECDRLRLVYDHTRERSRTLKRDLEETNRNESQNEVETEWREKEAKKEEEYAVILRRQAEEYRELAEAADESARRNRERHEKYPNTGWDQWAERDVEAAAERRRKADELEREAEELEARSRELEREAEEIRTRKGRIERELEQTRQREEQEKINWEECVEQLEELCPEESEEIIIIPISEEIPVVVEEDPKVCGPDITENVMRVLKKIIDDYNAATPTEQQAACDALFDDDTAEFAWDISQLSPAIAPDPDDPDSKGWFEWVSEDCATPRHYPCGTTVTFLGECIHSQVVNYVQWGVMVELCETRTKAAIAHWLRATAGASWSDGEFKAPHYQGQKVMTAVGMQFAHTKVAVETDPDFKADPARYTPKYKHDFVRDVMKTRMENEAKEFDEFNQRQEADCQVPCPISEERQRILNRRTWTYTWYGITDDIPSR